MSLEPPSHEAKKALLGELELALEALANSIPQYVVDSLREQAQRIKQLAMDIKAIEVRLAEVLPIDVEMKRVAAIPGVGLLSATAAIATMGEAKAFKSWREFCAWLGLVPKQRGTGGRVNLLGISKRGDTYLRTLLIHGARAVLRVLHGRRLPAFVGLDDDRPELGAGQRRQAPRLVLREIGLSGVVRRPGPQGKNAHDMPHCSGTYWCWLSLSTHRVL